MIGVKVGFKPHDGAYLESPGTDPRYGYIISQNSYDLTDVDFLNLSVGGIKTASVNIGLTLSLECIEPSSGNIICSGTSTMGDYSWSHPEPIENVCIDVSNLKGNYKLRLTMCCWNKKAYLTVQGFLVTPIKIWGTMK